MSGLTGSFRLRTSLGAARYLESSEYDGVLLLPAALTNPLIQLNDSNAFAVTSFQLYFDVFNGLQSKDMIRIVYPPFFHYEPAESSTQLHCLNSSVMDDLSIIASNSSYVLLQRKGLSLQQCRGRVFLQLSAIQNRNGSAGDSGAWTVETLASSSNLTMDKGIFSVQITTAHFKDVKVDVTALDSRAPTAGQEVNLTVKLQVNQPMVPPDSRIVIDLGSDLSLTRDTIIKIDCKEPYDYVDYCPGASWNYTCPFSILDVQQSGLNVLTIKRQRWSVLHQAIGKTAEEGSDLTFHVSLLATRATAGPFQALTFQHVASTARGLEVYEQDSVKVTELSPCLNEAQVELQEASLGSKSSVTVTVRVCSAVEVEERVGLFLSAFISCQDQDCDSFRDVRKFSIGSIGNFNVTSAELEYAGYHFGNISDSSIQISKCSNQDGWNSGLIIFTITGFRNPDISPLLAPRAYVQTLSSSLEVFHSHPDTSWDGIR